MLGLWTKSASQRETPGLADSSSKIFVSHHDFDCVLHTASPFTQKWADAVKEILDPAVKGTVETLRSIHAHAPTVKRVVILSSFVTLMNSSAETQVYDESMWNPVTWDAAVTDRRLTYTGSKVSRPGTSSKGLKIEHSPLHSQTLAERAAWDFVRSKHPDFDLVSLNPPLVFGPVAHHLPSLDKLNTSNQRVRALVQGAFRDSALPPTGMFLWVDVRDVALAHVRAMETPAAGGERFMLVGGHFSNKTLTDAIAETHPELAPKLPLHAVDDTPASVYQYDSAKAAVILGIEFRSFRDCIEDTVTSLQKAGA